MGPSSANGIASSKQDEELMNLTLQLRNRKNEEKYAKFHGDNLIGNQIDPKVGLWSDIGTVLQPRNWPALKRTFDGYIKGDGLDGQSLASIAGSLSDYSVARQKFIDGQVKDKYDKMLHPPLTYLGDAFQYRTADGKFNSVINPHLGQAGAPYAKTVPSKTASLGALPDPSDLFDKLMARQKDGRESESGLSSMLVYHATIIIHDIFRTNDNDKNISDSSSYLDLSPLYGYTMEMQRKVRDGKYKLGLLKPDTFAEDRLLRQPPGVCIMLVMYNRYHNYAARQLLRINENGRFSIPRKFGKTKLVSLVKEFVNYRYISKDLCEKYEKAWREYQAVVPESQPDGKLTEEFMKSDAGQIFMATDVYQNYKAYGDALETLLNDGSKRKYDNISKKPVEFNSDIRAAFLTSYDAAWAKQDDDLFNTARLITCGMYIQISVHDYLRALMGFHQFDTNFTLDPRADFDQKKTSRGIGNQVTVEFNLLYRFHCAISLNDEKYTEEYMRKGMGLDPDHVSLGDFLKVMAFAKTLPPKEPWEVTFGISNTPHEFTRNPVTNLFDDEKMIESLTAAMDAPISNFGPRNVPKCLKPVEILGIIQARKWEVGTLNDFREFFGMERHATFESVTKNVEIQNALRDLYEHPDKIELYPGIFCESDENMGLDPGPAQANSALWTAIFSDAITLVRSDRFYTVDWNTNSLTSWGMKEVTPDNSICKSSVFHRLIQRAFPGWFKYDTIRFFHPFYTAKQNAVYAKAQGYGSQFEETQSSEKKQPSEFVAAAPQKPEKPLYLHNIDNISTVVANEDFINPALQHCRGNLPDVVDNVLYQDRTKPELVPPGILDAYVSKVEKDLKHYLDALMRDIVKRESISMTNATFQIDVTRDFAIPVVTKYVADFLGFADKLRTDINSVNTYTENEIYQHITNCQVFLSYNADETKMMKRRKAFKTSMAFLVSLTRQGNISEANKWDITKALFGKRQTNGMSQLGVFVAKQVLAYENDQGKAAAILLLVCLDFAYNAVVSCTATLDSFMKDLYDAAYTRKGDPVPEPKWAEVQKLAFSIKSDDDERELEQIIQTTAQARVKLPIVRKARKEVVLELSNEEKVLYTDDNSQQIGPRKVDVLVEKGKIVILDLSMAATEAIEALAKAEKAFANAKTRDEATKAAADAKTAAEAVEKVEALASQLRIANKFSAFQPKRLAVLTLTSMVKFIAQMKNPRRGHDAQGRLKRVRIDPTTEGYFNFMAPMRVRSIEEKVKQLPDDDKNKKIFTDDILKPDTDIYLTPTWDEMVPFPMTWKIRFDGFGKSDYDNGDIPFGKLRSTQELPDDAPPFYQPQGPSHVGGTFAGVVCICAAAQAAASARPDQLPKADGKPIKHESHCPCHFHSETEKRGLQTSKLSTGCGLGNGAVSF